MIDTRKKIVSPEEARRIVAKGEVRAVRTYCDPMLPAHVSDLRALAGDGRLLLVIDTPADAYLEVRARQEIAASLGFVAAVTAGDVAFAESLGAVDAVIGESAHRLEFLATVRRKSGS
ncbi:MAG: hypothetical protein U0R19_11810 [Bryobacteraceae bacterium]